MENQVIGAFIRKKRKELGLTQKDLAKKLCITDKAISKWERGLSCPDIGLLKELSLILGVSVNELLSGQEIEQLEREQTDDLLIHSVKTYTLIEKRKRKRLWIFTIFLFIFYVLLIFLMYLIFNRVNKTDGLTWETLQNMKMSDQLYTALENYDYEYIRSMIRSSLPANYVLYEGIIEDEGKCDYYLTLVENGKIGSDDWGMVCRLKDFENYGIRFASHKYFRNYYSGFGNFSVDYSILIEYQGYELPFLISSSIHNGVFTELNMGTYVINDDGEETKMLNEFEKQFPLIWKKIISFFQYEEEYPKDGN